jgi:hypothetical protein
MLVIPILGWWRQGDFKLKSSLGYIVGLYLKKYKTKEDINLKTRYLNGILNS